LRVEIGAATVLLLSIIIYDLLAKISIPLGSMERYQADVVLVVVVFVASLMTWLLARVIDHNTRRYQLTVANIALASWSVDILFSEDFLQSNALLVGANTAFPILLLFRAIISPSVTSRLVMIIVILFGVGLLVMLIANLMVSIRIVADQLYLRAALLSTNLVSKDNLSITDVDLVYRKGYCCTIIDKLSLREGWNKARKFVPHKICPGRNLSDNSAYSVGDRHHNDARVLYDIVFLDDDLPLFKVIEAGPDVLRIGSNARIATISIRYFRFGGAEQTATGLPYGQGPYSDKFQIVWYSDKYDKEFLELVGLTS